MKISQSFTFSVTLMIVTMNLFPLAGGTKILTTVLLSFANSHTKSISAITGALTNHGHNVTILTSSAVGTRGFNPDTYNRAIQFKLLGEEFQSHREQVRELSSEKSEIKKMMAFGIVFKVLNQACKCLFDDSETLFDLKSSNFDLLIADAFDGCDAILAAYLGIPYIAVTTSGRYPFFHERLYGIPAPSSYVPLGISLLPDKMSFLERVASFLEHNVVINLANWFHLSKLNDLKNRHGIALDKDMKELIGGAELWLCMANFAFEFAHPTAPNWVAIGNVADFPAKPLENEFKEFVEESGEHGFIVFSLGHNYGELPVPGMAEIFARVFSELPQRVIWRHTGKRPHHLGNNTMLVDWMPQNDLIGHPKAQLLIYHGGLTGILEAIYHGVPMVVMPLFGDQDGNAIKVKAKGMGLLLRKDEITYETVKAAVREVLDNQRYSENVRRASRIYRDQQSTTNETVVFWVEHILKFGGSHLKPRALELNFIQLHSIDVVVFIGGIVLVTIFLMYSCCKRCLSGCFKRKKTKVE